MARLKEKLQYQFNRLFARGTGLQYALLGGVFVLLALVGMNAWFFGLFSERALEAEGIDADFGGGFLDAVWWSVKHVIDPGAFSEDYGAPVPVLLISFVVSIMGLGLFGVFIAFISTSVQARMKLLAKGNTVVVERGHTLILGWSNKVRSILEFLNATERRQVVTLLAPVDVEQMRDQIKSDMRDWRNLELVFRAGSTSRLSELERVGLATAGSVISLAYDRDGRGEADVEAIKTLMLLSGYGAWQIDPPPTLVAEITQLRHIEIANIAGKRRVPIVSSSEIISRIIVQSARQPGISAVYREIFSNTGNRLVVEAVPGVAGQTVGELMHWFADAIPLGITWQEGGAAGRTAAALNPEPDYDLAEDEKLIFLSAGNELTATPGSLTESTAGRGDGRKERHKLGRVLVLGWNDNIDEILTEFDAHASENAVVTVLAAHEPEYCVDYLAAVTPGGFRNIEVDYRRGNSTNRNSLEGVTGGGYDCVIVLADESWGEADPDARTILTLLQIADMAARSKSREVPHIVVELLDAGNRELLAGTPVGDIIVSPEIVSLQLAQVSRNPLLGAVYRELLSAGGMECSLQPASRYVALDEPCTFRDVMIRAQEFLETAIGVSVGSEGEGGRRPLVYLNPDKDARFVFTADDAVIVLAQQVYD